MDGTTLLVNLWEEQCRPSLRWLRDMQKRRIIPYFKVGHRVFFDAQRVREALEKRAEVRAKGGAA